MDAFFARNRLSAYLDGSLDPSEAALVETALAQDPALAREYEQLRRAVALLRQLGPAPAPEGFHARVLAEVRKEPPPAKIISIWRRTLGRLPVEALALAAAALIVVLVIQGSQVLPELGASATREERAPAEKAIEIGPPGGAPEPPPPVAASPLDGDLRTAPRAPATGAAAPPPEAAAKGSTSSKKASLPEQPYYSDWEQGGAEPGLAAGQEAQQTGTNAAYNTGIALEGPRSYRISLADPEVLFRLAAVAEKAGARLMDGDGRPMAARSLGGEDGWTRVLLVAPRSNAALVEKLIGGMGGVPVPPPGGAPLYGTDQAVFVVEVAVRP